jgi:imidazolonepropionase-like amidohydrolase
MGLQPRGQDRLPGVHVAVDLERRIHAGQARRDQDIGCGEVPAQLIQRPLAQKADPARLHEVRRRQREGRFEGARLYTASRGFGVVGGYPPLQPDATTELDVHRLTAPDEAEDAVAEVAETEVDFIKLWVDHHFETLPSFSPEIYERIIRAAQEQGVRTVAHIHTAEDAHALVDAGIDGLVHSVRDLPVDEALIEKMRARDLFSVSTLVREESMFIYAQRAPYLDDPFFLEHVPDDVVETLASDEFQDTHRTNPELEEWEPALRTAQRNLKTLYDAGIKIGFGSDSGPPARFEGYFEHREMELMAEAGLTPAQIIQIATRNSAEILGIDSDFGTVEPGKMAEFLILDRAFPRSIHSCLIRAERSLSAITGSPPRARAGVGARRRGRGGRPRPRRRPGRGPGCRPW